MTSYMLESAFRNLIFLLLLSVENSLNAKHISMSSQLLLIRPRSNPEVA